MKDFIPKDASIDTVLALIQVLEIRGDNPHILKLQGVCHEELRAILEGATPAFLTGVILEGRKQVRESRTPLERR